MSGYNVCCLYRALKLHFTTDYDYSKYNGRINYSVAQYEKNKHKFVYEKIHKKYSGNNLLNFLIANFIQNENVWVQDLLSQESYELYVKYNKKIQSMSYTFENDLLNIFSESDHKQIFKSSSNDFPLLLTKMLRSEVSLETVIIMNEFLNFIPKWEQDIKDDFIWPRIKSKLIKYKPFIEYDKSKCKIILKNSIAHITQ
jgi:hypothetical protein